MSKEKNIAFFYVEAGMGHIMPLRAIQSAYNQHYGEANTKTVEFFKHPSSLKEVEEDFIKQVKLHNKHPLWGKFQVLLMRLLGQKFSLWFLFKVRYKKHYRNALKVMEKTNASIMVHTHFSTLYYACEANKKGLTDATNIAYCPDPVVGPQWDKRADNIITSYKELDDETKNIPFLLNPKIKDYEESKTHYKKQLGLNPDAFSVLLADGAYGSGKIGETTKALLTSDKPLNLIVVCGRNEALKEKLESLNPPDNIHLTVYGFTNSMYPLEAASDLFIGKAGASILAEATYFNVPSIITLHATPIENWISDYYVSKGTSKVIKSPSKLLKQVETFIREPSALAPYIEACKRQDKEVDGAYRVATIIKNKL